MRCGLALLLVWAGLACEPIKTTALPEVEGYRHRPSYAMHVLYRRNLVVESRRRGEPYERGRPAIDPARQLVFIGSSDRGLYALRAQDGAPAWRFETMGPVQSDPLYDRDTDAVYFGSNDGALYKVNATSGELKWRFATNAEVNRQPVARDGRLYFVNANDTVICADAESGKRIWSQHRTPAFGMEVAGHAGLLLHDNRVFVAFSSGTVAAFDAGTGRELWEPVDLAAEAEQALGEVPKYLDVDTTPRAVTVGGTDAIVVGSYAGGVTALVMETGNQLWFNNAVLGVTDVSIWRQRAHTDATQRVHNEKNYVIASTGTTGLWALEVETGHVVWRRDLPDGGTSSPAFISGAMLVSTTRHGLFLISPLDGAIIDGIHTQAGFSMPARSLGQRAFILSDTGQFMALSVPRPGHPETGSPYPVPF